MFNFVCIALLCLHLIDRHANRRLWRVLDSALCRWCDAAHCCAVTSGEMRDCERTFAQISRQEIRSIARNAALCCRKFSRLTSCRRRLLRSADNQFNPLRWGDQVRSGCERGEIDRIELRFAPLMPTFQMHFFFEGSLSIDRAPSKSLHPPTQLDLTASSTAVLYCIENLASQHHPFAAKQSDSQSSRCATL